MSVRSEGEKQGDREVMDRNVRDLVEANVPPDKAREMAKESMQRVDRKLRRGGTESSR